MNGSNRCCWSCQDKPMPVSLTQAVRLISSSKKFGWLIWTSTSIYPFYVNLSEFESRFSSTCWNLRLSNLTVVWPKFKCWRWATMRRSLFFYVCLIRSTTSVTVSLSDYWVKLGVNWPLYRNCKSRRSEQWNWSILLETRIRFAFYFSESFEIFSTRTVASSLQILSGVSISWWTEVESPIRSLVIACSFFNCF